MSLSVKCPICKEDKFTVSVTLHQIRLECVKCHAKPILHLSLWEMFKTMFRRKV